ncbi:MAG: hypothetical protein U0636_11990 [Phycisphaerales bacterium]
MSDRSDRFIRPLWILALVLTASALAVLLWKRSPGLRSSATELVRRVESLGAGTFSQEVCETVSDPPPTGPVRLPVCKAEQDGTDPWLVPFAHGPDLAGLASIAPHVQPKRWAWEDVNTVPILRWEGDARVIAPNAKGRQYAVKGLVDMERARAMELAFGYQIDNAVIRYRSEQELLAKRQSLDRVLAAHGVVRQHGNDGDVLAPDYDWMVEASLEDVRPLAMAIVKEARQRGARGLREEFGALASFVQQLEYGEAPNPGDGKHRFGLSMPLWALASNRGDCDTRAVLLVALARSVNLCPVELVRDAQHQHMLAAAAIPVKKGDHVVRPNGYTLVLVETTDNWPVGRVAGRTNENTLQTLFLASPHLDKQGPPVASVAGRRNNRQ